MKTVAVSLALLLVASALSATPKAWTTREAAAEAERDMASHKIKFYLWGGYAAQPVGVPTRYYGLVLRHHTVMVGQGCIVYDAALNQRQREYAETYNTRMLKYVLRKSKCVDTSKHLTRR